MPKLNILTPTPLRHQRTLLLPKGESAMRSPVYTGPKHAGQAGVSLVLAGGLMAGLLFIFTLFAFPEIVSAVLPPTQVVNSPPPPTEEVPLSEKGVSNEQPDPAFAHPVAPPTVRPRPIIAVAGAELPRIETPPIAAEDLINQAAENAKLIEQIKEEQEAELAELRREREKAEKEKQRKALIAKKKKAEQDAKRAAERAITKKRNQEKAREVAARKAAQRKAQSEQDARDRAVAAARKQEQREQARRASLAQKVVSAPSVSRRTTPRYPTSARKAGLEGTTQIAATVNSRGRVSSARVTVSSGHSSLDSSALAAVKKWRFKPARNGLGEGVAQQLVVPVTFRLR